MGRIIAALHRMGFDMVYDTVTGADLTVIEEANEFGGTYENREDDAYDALERMETLIKKFKFTWDFRKPIVDEMLEQIFEGNSGFEDMLMDHCEMLCKTRDEKLIWLRG